MKLTFTLELRGAPATLSERSRSAMLSIPCNFRESALTYRSPNRLNIRPSALSNSLSAVLLRFLFKFCPPDIRLPQVIRKNARKRSRGRFVFHQKLILFLAVQSWPSV